MRYHNNPYYSAEKFGLEIIDELEHSSGSYEFDKHVVWKDKAGKFWWAWDSGCSCPTPFENSVIEEITDFKAFRDMVMAHNGEPTLSEKLKFLDKIEKALKS